MLYLAIWMFAPLFSFSYLILQQQILYWEITSYMKLSSLYNYVFLFSSGSFWMAPTLTGRRSGSSAGQPPLPHSSARVTSSGSSFTLTSQVPVRDSCFSGRQPVIRYLPPRLPLEPLLPVRKPLYQRKDIQLELLRSFQQSSEKTCPKGPRSCDLEDILNWNKKIHFVPWNLQQQFRFLFTESLLYWVFISYQNISYKKKVHKTLQLTMFFCVRQNARK